MRVKRVIAGIAIAGSLIVGLSACDDGTQPQASAQKTGQKQTEQAFNQQSTAVPYPVSALRDSLERRNIRERLLRTNKPDAVGYVYLQGLDGKPYAYYVIKGKISSTQSQMTTDQLVVTGDCSYSSSCYDHVVVSAPGDDGSYGENEKGIFFFTVEGVFVETDSKYTWSDHPLPLSVPKWN